MRVQLHKGVGHVVVNVVFIVFLGAAVERHWPWKRYLVFLVVAGYVSIAVGAAVKLAFADDPVAFLGASGILFALAGYAFVHHLTWSHTQMSRVEWFASFFGALLLLVVLADIVAGPYVDPDWFNGGHAGGFVVGALAGRFGWSRCGLRYYDPG